MVPFRPNPDWYYETWYEPDPPRRPRPRLVPMVVGVAVALLAVGAVIVVQPVAPAPQAIHFG